MEDFLHPFARNCGVHIPLCGLKDRQELLLRGSAILFGFVVQKLVIVRLEFLVTLGLLFTEDCLISILGGDQGVVVRDIFLVGTGKLGVGTACFCNGVIAVFIDLTDAIDHVNDFLCACVRTLHGICHVVQTVFAGFEAIIRNECVGALFRRHLIVATAICGMLEAAVLLLIAQKILQYRIAVLHKTGICVGIQTECTKCDNDLRSGFRVRCTERCKAAIILLHTGQQRKCCFDCRFDFRMIFVVVRCKCLKRHRGHINVRCITGVRPAVVFGALVKNCVNQFVTIIIDVITTIYREERPNRTVAALLFHIAQIIQRGQKVAAAYAGGIFANSGQGKNDTGVLGRFVRIELSFGIDVCFHIGYNTVIIAVVVAVRDACVAARQTKDCPFAVGGTNLRRGNCLLDVGKRLIQMLAVAGVLTRAALFQLFKCGNRLTQPRCFNAGLIGQRVIRSLCGVDLLLVGKGDFVFVGQIINQQLHMVLVHPKDLLVSLIDYRNRFCCKVLFLVRSQCIERRFCSVERRLVTKIRLAWEIICGSRNGIRCGHILDNLVARDQLVILRRMFSLKLCLVCIAHGVEQAHSHADVSGIIQRQMVFRGKIINNFGKLFCIATLDNLNGVLCGGAAVIHAAPCTLTNADVDHVARGHRQHIAAHVAAVLILIGIEIHPRLIVFVCGGKADSHAGFFCRDRQHIICRRAGERRGQFQTAVDGQRAQRGIHAAPCAANVNAELCGVHEMDFVAVFQSAVGVTEVGEAGVDEPIILCTHPAGVGAAGELCECTAVFFERSKVGCAVVMGVAVPGISRALQCFQRGRHHAVTIGQVIIAIDDRVLQRSRQRFIQIRCVFNDHMNAANILRAREALCEVIANFAGFRRLPDCRHLLHRGDGFLSGGNDVGFGRCVGNFVKTGVQRRFKRRFSGFVILGLIQTVVLRINDLCCSFLRPRQLRAVAFDRPPCDRDGHIVIRHCKAVVALVKLDVEPLSILALIARVVVENQTAVGNVIFADAVVANALDLILNAVNLDRKIARYVVVQIGTVLLKGDVFIGDRPFCAVYGERTIAVLEDCIADMEVCCVFQICKQTNRCQRFCHSIRNFNILPVAHGCKHERRIGLDMIVSAAARAGVLRCGVVVEPLNHIVQCRRRVVRIANNVKRQVVLDSRRECLALFVHVRLNLIVLGFFSAGDLRTLIAVHVFVALEQLLRRFFDGGACCDLVGIIRETVQISPERLKRCFVRLNRLGLLALDEPDCGLLRKVRFAGRSRRVLQYGNRIVVRIFDLRPCVLAENLLRIGIVNLIQSRFQFGADSIGLCRFSDGQLQIRSRNIAGVENRLIFVVCARVVGGDKIVALLIELEAHGAACVRRSAGQQGRRVGVTAVLVLRTIGGNRRALIRAVAAGPGPEMRGRALDGKCRFFASADVLRAGFLEAQRTEGARHVCPVYGFTVDVVVDIGRPLHVVKLDHIAVFQHITVIYQVLLNAGRPAIEKRSVDERAPDAVAVFVNFCIVLGTLCLLQEGCKC